MERRLNGERGAAGVDYCYVSAVEAGLVKRRVPPSARLAAVVAVTIVLPTAAAGTGAVFRLTSAGANGAVLAQRYAPILLLATGEKFRPLDRDGFVSSAQLRFVNLRLLHGVVRREDFSRVGEVVTGLQSDFVGLR